MKKIIIPVLAATLFGFTGCMTEQTRYIAAGEDTEETAGLAEKDIRRIVSAVTEDIDRASVRYARPNARRVVNVKDVKVDTTARGSQAGYLATTIAQCFREELMNGQKFVVYNETAAQNAYAAGRPVTVTPEFVLTATLREQNVRRDNGNFYREYSLLIQLTDVATNLDFWQKRVPLSKAVDQTRIMN